MNFVAIIITWELCPSFWHIDYNFAKLSQASASALAEISLIIDSSHTHPGKYQNLKFELYVNKMTSIEDDLNGRQP